MASYQDLFKIINTGGTAAGSVVNPTGQDPGAFGITGLLDIMINSQPDNSEYRTGVTADSLNAQQITGLQGTGGTLKYNFKQFSYPEKTSVAADQQHYVAFYINITGASKFNYGPGQQQEITANQENKLNKNVLGQSAQTVAKAGGVGFGVSMGPSVANKVLGNTINGNSPLAKIIGQASGAVAGATLGYYAGKFLGQAFQPKNRQRIDTGILLAIQNPPSVNYGVDYTQEDLGSIAGYMAGGSSAVDTNRMQMANEALQGVGLGLSQSLGSLASAIGMNLNPANIASATSSRTPNPFREQLFKAVDARTFRFEYKFLPRSKSEADNVRRIIDTFKFHMHPEISTGGLFYIYPSEFNIVYYWRGKENLNMNRISTCVLENMHVDYGGASFNTFDDTGMPTEVNLKLTFKETETLTKERIQNGY